MIKNILTVSLVVIGSVTVASPIHALTYLASFKDTVSSVGGSVSGVSSGNSAVISVALDNGGNSINNQTWNSGNATSITFNFNNGENITVFNPTFSTNIGSFVTDSSGTLTSVASDWRSGASIQSTNLSPLPIAWLINGFNAVVFYGGGGSVSLQNVSRNTNPAFWTISPTTPVPFEFSLTLPLIVLGVL